MEANSGDVEAPAATTSKGAEEELQPTLISQDPAPPPAMKAPEVTEDAPDPDEDDLDDLDGNSMSREIHETLLTYNRYAR
jgi:hypothetical protein